MRLLFVADARSPIAVGWINYFIKRGHDVHVISTYPCAGEAYAGAAVYQQPVAFADWLSYAGEARTGGGQKSSRWRSRLAGLRKGVLAPSSVAARMWAGPLELQRHIKPAREIMAQVAPDLVHAMRIPFEGMLAAQAVPESLPLMISIWGNDLTLIASRYPLIARQTRRVLQRADVLHCDCLRDVSLAEAAWGFQESKPRIVLPSSGGIHAAMFHAGARDQSLMNQFGVDEDAPVLINPRGFRGYVRNEVFFAALPAVLKKHPKAIFLCVAMQGNPMAQRWLKQFGVAENVRLLPAVTRDEMAGLFRLAQVAVSPSLHDGTPNTLLEAMACGCLPVAGDIDSVREWVDDGVNGLLCDATNVESLAAAMVRALDDEPLRRAARHYITRLIGERAEYGKVMQQAEDFYRQVVERKRQAVRG